MRMCDRHNRTRAVDTMNIQSTEETFDLCKDCSDLVLAFMQDPKKDTVEKKSKRKLWGKD